MKANAVKWGMLVAVNVWGLGGGVLHAQDEQEVVSMVETALAEFETPNGPIVQLESHFRCSGVERAEGGYCPVPYAETLLTEYASEQGLVLVAPPSASPGCISNREEAQQDKGFRMTLGMQRDPDGVVWARIRLTCWTDAGAGGGGLLLQAYGYPFRLVDGAWKRSGEVESITISP